MNLITTIKQDQLKARKNKHNVVATILTTLLGEALMIGKDDGDRETTDKEVLGIIRKFIKNIDFTIEQIAVVPDALITEKTVLQKYLPVQLTYDALNDAIYSIIDLRGLTGMKGLGVVMKQLNQNFNGQYDGKQASSIAKGMLA